MSIRQPFNICVRHVKRSDHPFMLYYQFFVTVLRFYLLSYQDENKRGEQEKKKNIHFDCVPGPLLLRLHVEQQQEEEEDGTQAAGQDRTYTRGIPYGSLSVFLVVFRLSFLPCVVCQFPAYRLFSADEGQLLKAERAVGIERLPPS